MVINSRKIYLKEEEIRFLIITPRDFLWISDLQEISKSVDIIQSEQGLLDALTDHNYHIIFYDEKTFDIPAPEVIDEIIQQATTAVVAVITDEVSASYYDELIISGASDIMSPEIQVLDLMQRITPMLHQSHKNSIVAERTRKLHATNLLAQKLHSAEHPTKLIVDAIDLICNYFDVYGVAITLDMGSNLHLYAGTRNTDDRRRIYESTAEMKQYDPLFHVITSGVSLIIADITQHPEYIPIPVIQEPKSTIIIPLKQGVQTIGSLAFFAKHNVTFTADDLAIFELLAVHFLSAYGNVRDHVWREADVQSMRQVLRAWPILNTAYSANDISSHLHKFVQEIASNQTVAIWLFHPDEDGNHGKIYTNSKTLSKSLNDIKDNGGLQSIISEFDVGMQPISFHKSLAKTEELLQLYEMIKAKQITLVPIAGNRFEGIVLIGNKLNQAVSKTDLSIIENLTRVAANVIERNMLIEELQDQKNRLQEQTGRIEGVLRSIREGIFFVDENGEVVYSNPQFTELSHIGTSTILSKSYKTLFKELSEKSSERQQTFDQLTQAFEQIFNKEEDENYPIVEIRNIPDTNIIVEFMRVDHLTDQKSWIGVVRSNELSSSPLQTNERTELLQDMLEDIGIPLTSLNKTTMMLIEQQGYLSSQKFESMLEDVDNQVQHIQTMWANYLQIHRGETSGIALRQTGNNPVEFMSELLATRRMFAYHRQIRFNEIPIKGTIEIDERLMRQSIINIVDFIVSISNRGAPIFIGILAEGQSSVVIKLHEKTTHVPEEVLTSILEPVQSDAINSDVIRYRLGIYLAKQIVDAHGGNLSILSGRGLGLTVKIQLPVLDLDSTSIPSETEVSYTETFKGLNVLVLESPSQYLSSMYSKLDVEGHTIISEKRLDDVLLDISSMKTDVIVLEADRKPSTLIANTQSIRSQSDVPIIIMASSDLESDCLQSLGLGADDYFLAPLNQEKLLAQLYSIANRHRVVSRTTEPIVIGDLIIDFSRRRVTLKDKLLNLTAKEYDLLRVLSMNRGQIVTHQQLLTKVWGPEYRDENQYLWVNISRLRRKLKPKKEDVQYIHNEQGVGYIFDYEKD